MRRIGLLFFFLLAATAMPSVARGQEAATCAGEPAPEATRAAEQPAGLCAEEPASPALPVAPAPVAAAAGGPRWADVGLAGVALAFGVFGLRVVVRNERRRGGRPGRRVERAPYVAGGALGVLFALSLTLAGRPVGISGGVQHVAGLVGEHLTGDYWGAVVPVGLTWPVWTIAGVVLGALAAALGDGSFGPTLTPAAAGPVWRRWLAVFVGGAALEYAGALAGGCTSGLALSGGIGLAPGAFVFMAAMFASGIPAAFLTRGRS